MDDSELLDRLGREVRMRGPRVRQATRVILKACRVMLAMHRHDTAPIERISDGDQILEVCKPIIERNVELREALEMAVAEIEQHNREYHHRTLEAKLAAWRKL